MLELLKESNSLSVVKAKDKILKGEVVCFKSDTVYAFCCAANDDAAVSKIYKLKNRDINKPISIFVKDKDMARDIFVFDEGVANLCDKYMPGFITLIAKLKKNSKFQLSKKLNLESDNIGFRIVEGEFVNSLLQELQFPIAVTSANISSSKELLCASDVVKGFLQKLSDFLLIDGGDCDSSNVSTVVKVDGGDVNIVRQGVLKITK